jgi:hypothetical protein
MTDVRLPSGVDHVRPSSGQHHGAADGYRIKRRLTRSSRSPQDGGSISGDDLVPGHEGHGFDLCLRDEHTIEWVVVMRRKARQPSGRAAA